MMKGLKLTGCILLCVCVVVLNSPQSAQAALFTKNAEAAIVATDAEATEMAYVTPQTNAGTALFSTGTGFTSIGNDLLGRLQQVFQPTPVEQIVTPSTDVMIDKQTAGGDQSGITVVPLNSGKAAVVSTPVVLMGEGKAALTIEEMIPVVPAEEIVMPPQAPAAGPATEEEKEKALFPLLWSGSGAAAAGAGAETGAIAGGGLLSTTGAKVIGIGLLLAAVALGIILPLALSSDGGGGGSSGGDGAANGGEIGGDGIVVPPIDDGQSSGAETNGGQDDGSAPIPEPLTLILFGTGLIGLFLRRRND